ncbi:MAG: hypothetical protein C0625_05945 [Arcobacter sp.]|nr:MAG: hypothetical protein C0625_05945 [Arcobacter sp.]
MINYLEVKFSEVENKEVDTSNFISNVINNQSTLGLNTKQNFFNHERLKKLGFQFNPTTNGYALKKEFSLEELEYLSKQIDLLENHTLTHGYIELKIYHEKLYFWDKALIYEGIDTFEYCMKHHNIFNLKNLNVLTKSDTINETLLNLVNYTKRYSEPSLEFITQNCLCDKKEAYKILKEFVKNANEYIPMNEALDF